MLGVGFKMLGLQKLVIWDGDYNKDSRANWRYGKELQDTSRQRWYLVLKSFKHHTTGHSKQTQIKHTRTSSVPTRSNMHTNSFEITPPGPQTPNLSIFPQMPCPMSNVVSTNLIQIPYPKFHTTPNPNPNSINPLILPPIQIPMVSYN